jgi:hypothetical protein
LVSHPEGLSHTIQGGSNRFRFDGRNRRFRTISTFSDGVSEGTKDFDVLSFVESIKVGIVLESDGEEV